MATHLPEGLSPDAVDILTELTAILTKLRASQNLPPAGLSTPALASLGALPGAPGATPGPGPLGASSQSQPSGLTPAPAPGATPFPSGAPGGISVKELTAATDAIKHKLQRARAAVKTLPDMNRTIEQQEAEIHELEARKKKQIAMLAKIREEGLQFARTSRDEAEGDRMVVG
ncbi:RNA polymerase II transcription mediator complex subunit 9 domain containing protein [Naviculisporaceae sp. PSN 640]